MRSAAFLLAAALGTPVWAVSTVNLGFDGGAGGAADTGFDGVYGLNGAGLTLAGGRLTLQTLPGDTFGQYENDPDSAANMFYSNLDAFDQTTVEARVRVSQLNDNFHGGGIWMGTDQDHYIRLGVFHNSFEGGVAIEALRENQDYWPGNTPPGPGNDINGRVIPNIAASPQTSPLDVILRLVRDGGTAQAFVSLDDGATFQQVGGTGFTFDGIVTGPGQGPNGGPSIEGGFKVGVYAVGGGDPVGLFAFDQFTANSVPEPGMLSLAALAGLALRRRR